MLKRLIRVLSTMLVLLFAQSEYGVASPKGAKDTPNDGQLSQTVSLSISALKILDDGSATIVVVLSNVSNLEICIGHDLHRSTYVAIRHKASKLELFSRADDSGIADPKYPSSDDAQAAANYNKRARSIPGGAAIRFEVTREPLVDPYLVDSSYVYVREVHRGEGVQLNASLEVFDCSYKTLGAAIKANDSHSVSSDWLDIKRGASAFIKVSD